MADKDFGLVTAVVDDVDGNDKPHELTTVGGGTPVEKPAFERYISFLGILNFGFTLQAAWEATALTLTIVFLNGGPASLIWGTLFAAIGHILVATSLAEMASMDPTVGAQYRWSARFARKWPEFWGLAQGWITTFAWIVTVPAPLITLATSVQALIVFHNPSHVPEAWQTAMIMWAFLLVAVIGNLYMRRMLNTLETIGGICHLLFFVACVTILTTLAERKSASYVFTTVISDVSGWNNAGICFQAGILTALLPLAGYDSVLHMIDETRKPRERVPKTMIAAVVSNSVLQFAYAIVLMFCIGDEEKVATSFQPVLEIYYQATKSKTAATLVLLMHMFIIVVGLFNIVASATRLTWAFSRDNGLPYSNFFVRINQRFQIPLQSLGLVCAITFIITLISLGSSVAMGAIMAIATTALLVSFFIPIFHLTLRKLAGEHPRYGPFKLGRWGLPINILSLCFCAYAAFWSAFPAGYPVAAETMNYAGPILIGLFLLCCVDWFTSGHKRFVVPTGIYNIEIETKSEKADRKDGV